MTSPRILVVDDEADIRELVQEILAEEGYDVSVAEDGNAARIARNKSNPDLVLLDIWMPDTDGISLLREWSRDGTATCPVVMMSGHGTVDTAVEATRLGAFDFIEKPLSMAKLLRTVELALESSHLAPGFGSDRTLIPTLVEPIGKSQVMQVLRDRMRKVADDDSETMLIGETGTGRETLARYLHSKSFRRNKPFVNVVVAGIRDDNATAVLFGNEQGDEIREGVLEQAHGGTLYLNELADMSPQIQRLLVSALQERGFTRVGGSKTVALTCRVLSSAQPDIHALLDGGQIRRDLFTLLNVIEIVIPPLRDYREDVPDLLRYYVDVLVDQEKFPFRRFSVAAQNRLRNYPWPGNIRELKNTVQRFLVLGDSEEISLDEIEMVLREIPQQGSAPLVKQDLLALPLREAREQFERTYLVEQLRLCDGKVGKLAERVGMERTHLYRKLRSLGIDISSKAYDE
ncbi:MAG: sigma-54 dependent transcriptional regulator [Gammaproteobacteria bacterium]